MDALEALPLEQLVSALKARLESGLNNGQFHPGFSLSSVLAIEEDLSKAMSVARSIRNTFAPINKLPPELLASITTSVNDPFRRTADCADLQFFCAAVCRYWRNSLLAFPRIWSSVDTTNSRHMKLYLARSKEAPLHVNYGCMTRSGVFEENIIPERHRLLSLSIPLDGATHIYVTRSLLESAESLKTLDMWMTHQQYPISTALMKKVSRFAPNITILRLHDITTGLSSFKFPALIKLTFRVTKPATRNPDAADLIKFLKHSPILEELDLRLPESFKADTSARTVALARLKSAVFSGYSAPSNESVGVNILPYLILPNQSITVDVQTSARAFSSDISPLLSVIQLGGAILPRQSITAATIHIKECPSGFFGHISICGERNNWIGVNHVQVLNRGTSPLSRLRNWLNPLNPAPLYGIQTLTLGLLEFASVEELCVGAFQSFLRGLDQVRVLNVHKMNVSLVARLLEPFDGTLLFPLLEELRFRTFDPPELARSVAHDKDHPGPGKMARPLQEPREGWGEDPEVLKFREWRHTLQKALLCAGPIKEEDMPKCDKVFKQLEDYDDDNDIIIECLAVSKIGKVMRHIRCKDEIPRQEEFRFQERANLLADRWMWLLAPGSRDYAKGSDFVASDIMDVNSSILHDAIRARRQYLGGVGGLKEVIVENAAGRVTSVTIPYT